MKSLTEPQFRALRWLQAQDRNPGVGTTFRVHRTLVEKGLARWIDRTDQTCREVDAAAVRMTSNGLAVLTAETTKRARAKYARAARS